ncbi:uncharacterized protein BJX67DRAFT_158541 [Aspergillus lucknowensis]|uniref:Uncharacterized protein n=1 Tax=Aspergillus lucknowensis TaxID=176173 RepID=A0ABR4M3Y5_9EURO
MRPSELRQSESTANATEPPPDLNPLLTWQFPITRHNTHEGMTTPVIMIICACSSNEARSQRSERLTPLQPEDLGRLVFSSAEEAHWMRMMCAVLFIEAILRGPGTGSSSQTNADFPVRVHGPPPLSALGGLAWLRRLDDQCTSSCPQFRQGHLSDWQAQAHLDATPQNPQAQDFVLMSGVGAGNHCNCQPISRRGDLRGRGEQDFRPWGKLNCVGGKRSS